VELRHGDRPALVPVAFPGRHPHRRYQIEPLRKALLLPRVSLTVFPTYLKGLRVGGLAEGERAIGLR
jgi:hypothetical protein